MGANDSGSSSAALFQIVRAIKTIAPDSNERCDITLIWFDGEEPVLPDWTDGKQNTLSQSKIIHMALDTL